MVRWQYRIVNVGALQQRERLVAALGALGAEGWELVGVYDKASNGLAGMEKVDASHADDHRPGDFDPITGIPL